MEGLWLGFGIYFSLSLIIIWVKLTFPDTEIIYPRELTFFLAVTGLVTVFGFPRLRLKESTMMIALAVVAILGGFVATAQAYSTNSLGLAGLALGLFFAAGVCLIAREAKARKTSLRKESSDPNEFSRAGLPL